MIIVGCDYHPSFQQIAFVDTETGELKEQRLTHREAAEEFYRSLAAGGQQVRVGMEASGQARWFERLPGGNCRSSCGRAMRRRYAANASVNKKRIGKMRSIF